MEKYIAEFIKHNGRLPADKKELSKFIFNF